MTAFDKIIDEARTRFAGYITGKNWLGRPKRDLATALRADGVDKDAARELAAIESDYEIGWAALFVANSELYLPKENASGAAVIVGRDPYFDARPDHLLRIANRLLKLRQMDLPENLDVATRNTATMVRADDGRPFSRRLPYKLTDGRAVWFTTTQIMRMSLPGKVIKSRLLPLAFKPDCIELNLVLPARCWPAGIRQSVDQLIGNAANRPPIESLPVSKQQLIDDETDARQNPFRVITADDVLLGASKGVVTLTPRCAAVIKKLAKQNRMGRNWWLRIGGTVNAREMDITAQCDEEKDKCIVSEGVKILIPATKVRQYRGIVLDYANTAGRDGFVFTEP